jgi:hypothetical protein
VAAVILIMTAMAMAWLIVLMLAPMTATRRQPVFVGVEYLMTILMRMEYQIASMYVI